MKPDNAAPNKEGVMTILECPQCFSHRAAIFDTRPPSARCADCHTKYRIKYTHVEAQWLLKTPWFEEWARGEHPISQRHPNATVVQLGSTASRLQLRPATTNREKPNPLQKPGNSIDDDETIG
jgi:hypothetical protein